jgi:ribosomal protein S1
MGVCLREKLCSKKGDLVMKDIITEGKKMTAKVVAFIDNGLVLDIGFVREGFVDANKLPKPIEEYNINDTIDVIIKNGYHYPNFYVRLAIVDVAFEQFLNIFNDGTRRFSGVIVEDVAAKGYIVSCSGVKVFCPAYKEVVREVGQSVDVKIKKVNAKKKNVVGYFSDNIQRQREIDAKKFDSISEGSLMIANVNRISNRDNEVNGLIVTINGLEGFLPISRMQKGYSSSPEALIGQDIPVLIQESNKQKNRLIVSQQIN